MKRPKYEWDLTPGFIACFIIVGFVVLMLLTFGTGFLLHWLLGLVDR